MLQCSLFCCLDAETFSAPAQGQGISSEDGSWLGLCWSHGGAAGEMRVEEGRFYVSAVGAAAAAPASLLSQGAGTPHK